MPMPIMVKIEEASPAPNSKNCDIRTEWFNLENLNNEMMHYRNESEVMYAIRKFLDEHQIPFNIEENLNTQIIYMTFIFQKA